MKKNRIYIIHGYQAHPLKHWFPWLMDQLGSETTQIESLTLPTPDEPVYEQWRQAIDDQVERLDEQTYFIGHSLGTITLLKYLHERLGSRKIGGLVLVAPFDDFLPAYPELNAYCQHEIDYVQLSAKIRHKHVLASKDDDSVPYDFSYKVHEKLASSFESYEDHGHFCACDGVKELPALLAYLRSILSHQASA